MVRIWFAAAITRLTSGGAFGGAIARPPTRRALATGAVSSSVSPVSIRTSVFGRFGDFGFEPGAGADPARESFFAEAAGAAIEERRGDREQGGDGERCDGDCDGRHFRPPRGQTAFTTSFGCLRG